MADVEKTPDARAVEIAALKRQMEEMARRLEELSAAPRSEQADGGAVDAGDAVGAGDTADAVRDAEGAADAASPEPAGGNKGDAEGPSAPVPDAASDLGASADAPVGDWALPGGSEESAAHADADSGIVAGADAAEGSAGSGALSPTGDASAAGNAPDAPARDGVATDRGVMRDSETLAATAVEPVLVVEPVPAADSPSSAPNVQPQTPPASDFEAYVPPADVAAAQQQAAGAWASAGEVASGAPVPPPDYVQQAGYDAGRQATYAGDFSSTQYGQPAANQQQATYGAPIGQQYQQPSGYAYGYGYGVAPQNPGGYQTPVTRTKDHVAAGLLGVFLGMFGIHKFYLGYNTAGFIMLGVTIVGGLFTFGLAASVVWLIGLIEGIIYLVKNQAEFEQTYLFSKKEWF